MATYLLDVEHAEGRRRLKVTADSDDQALEHALAAARALHLTPLRIHGIHKPPRRKASSTR